MHLWLMWQIVVNASSYPSMCTNKWCPTASTLCPLSLPCKNHRSACGHSHAQNEVQKDHGGFFECNAYCVMALGWLKKERRRTILIFDRFRLVILEQVSDTNTVTVDWGSLYIISSKCLWTLAFAAQWNYRCANANTLIGATILFPSHP